MYVVPTLYVVKAGTGSGTLTSTPAGINCGGGCTQANAAFAPGVVVSVTAVPAAGSRFVQWVGDCSGTGACSVAMNSLKVVGAVFEPATTFNLSVLRSGSGSVTSAPAGINCGVTCTVPFNQGASVTLTATPTAGWTFTNWAGACNGTLPTCTVTINSNTGAIAYFKLVSLGSAVDNTSLSWSSQTPAWFSQSTTWNSGGSAAQSAAIVDMQSTAIRTVVAGPGALSFKWKVASEAGFDYLSFAFDGWEQVAMSGDSGWVTDIWYIPAGNHILTWAYSKDASTAALSDAGWLDAVTFVPGAAVIGGVPATMPTASPLRPVRRDFGPIRSK